MNKVKNIVLSFILLLTIMFTLAPMNVRASEPTDKIINYVIDITPREDATLYIKYHIEWEVLESDNAGALEWVKIGLPNKHFSEVTAISSNIDYIETTTSGGAYANIYFVDEYVKGDIVSFDFSIQQDYMYSMNKEKEGFTKFAFTPGWFDEMEVENLTINWYGKEAESFNPNCTYNHSCYTWNTSLKMGEKFTIELLYPNETYSFDSTKDMEDVKDDEISDWLCVILIIILILAFIITMASDDGGYSSGSGFGGSRTVFIHSGGGSRSSCVSSSCACACACACAGGGRAGCSTKDFYNTNLKLKQLELKKKKHK